MSDFPKFVKLYSWAKGLEYGPWFLSKPEALKDGIRNKAVRFREMDALLRSEEELNNYLGKEESEHEHEGT